MPISAQARCLLRTYTCELASSPMRIVARPGVTPCWVRAATRSFSSSLIAAAVALPSMIVAAMSPHLPGSTPPLRLPFGRLRASSPPWLVASARSVVEVAFAGEHPRDAVLVGGRDDVVVLDPPARLDDRHHSGGRSGLEAVRERIEAVGR